MLYDQVKDFYSIMPKEVTPLVGELRAYLKEKSGLDYDEVTCERTIADIMALDEDLLAFVQTFVSEGVLDTDGIVYKTSRTIRTITMEELLDQAGLHPIPAALVLQQYRQDKFAALRGLLLHDEIVGDGDVRDPEETTFDQ